MMDQLKTTLVWAAVVPLGLLLVSLILLYLVNNIPGAYKLRVRKSLLSARFYFLKNKGDKSAEHFEMWFKIIDEALKSDLQESEIYEFIADYFNKYIYVQSSGCVFDPSVFKKDQIIKISQEYIKNARLLSSNR